MHNPELNPSTNLARNGKTRRYANGTVATRHVRLDRAADRNLTYLQRTLTGDNPSEFVSVSLVCRRALYLFSEYVAALGSGTALESERARVRQGSRVPHLRKKAEGLPRLAVRASTVNPARSF
jgi:hypothetical protein